MVVLGLGAVNEMGKPSQPKNAYCSVLALLKSGARTFLSCGSVGLCAHLENTVVLGNTWKTSAVQKTWPHFPLQAREVRWCTHLKNRAETYWLLGYSHAMAGCAWHLHQLAGGVGDHNMDSQSHTTGVPVPEMSVLPFFAFFPHPKTLSFYYQNLIKLWLRKSTLLLQTIYSTINHKGILSFSLSLFPPLLLFSPPPSHSIRNNAFVKNCSPGSSA